MDKEPEVTLSPTRVVCASHGEHLRAPWPTGFLTFGLVLFKAAVESPGFTRQARKIIKRPFGKIPPAVIDKITAKTPLCYYATREQIREAFIEADILTKQRCDICGVVRLGGPYDYMERDGSRVTNILCIECALDAGEREHAAYPKGPPPRG